MNDCLYNDSYFKKIMFTNYTNFYNNNIIVSKNLLTVECI